MPKSLETRAEFAGFADLHQKLIAPYLAEQEQRRRSEIGRFATILAVTALGASMIFAYAPIGEARLQGAILLGGAGASAALGFLNRTRGDITDGLLQRICGFFGFAYARSPMPPPYFSRLRRLGLLPAAEIETFEDEVKGRRGDRFFSLCEVRLQVRTKGKRRSKRTVFHGQLFEIEYRRRFAGVTVLRRDMGALNALFKPGKNFQRVGIVASEFEKAFEAWSTDQVEARDILDPIVLERFIELERLFGGKKLRAAFVDGRALIAVETGDRLGVGTMFRPIDGIDRVRTILDEFGVIFDLIDRLVDRGAQTAPAAQANGAA